MTKTEYLKMKEDYGKDAALRALSQDVGYACLWTVWQLEDLIAACVKNSDWMLADHLLHRMIEDSCLYSDWYLWDQSMGIMETPTLITEIDDIDHLFEDWYMDPKYSGKKL